MMATSTKIAPPNSVVLVMDSGGGTIPDSMRGHLISATDSCIAVGSKSEDDGETEIVIGAALEVDPREAPSYEGRLSTPSRKIVVKTVLGANVLEIPVQQPESVVRIWANDGREPDRIIIGVA